MRLPVKATAMEEATQGKKHRGTRGGPGSGTGDLQKLEVDKETQQLKLRKISSWDRRKVGRMWWFRGQGNSVLARRTGSLA